MSSEWKPPTELPDLRNVGIVALDSEERDDGILIRPAVVVPIEKYTPERKAEFLLSNATTHADYRKARKAVAKLGLDPDSIPHRRPA